VLEDELGQAKYLLLSMMVGTLPILKLAKLEILAEALPIENNYTYEFRFFSFLILANFA
jgi:hypothetical protein